MKTDFQEYFGRLSYDFAARPHGLIDSVTRFQTEQGCRICGEQTVQNILAHFVRVPPLVLLQLPITDVSEMQSDFKPPSTMKSRHTGACKSWKLRSIFYWGHNQSFRGGRSCSSCIRRLLAHRATIYSQSPGSFLVFLTSKPKFVSCLFYVFFFLLCFLVLCF